MQHHPEFKKGARHKDEKYGEKFYKKFDNLLEVLEYRAELHPNDNLYTFLQDGDVNKTEQMSFLELEQRAKAVGAKMQGRNPEKAKGRKAVLLFPFDGFDFNVAFFSCLATGITAVPTYPPDPTRLERSLPRFTAILSDCTPVYGLTNRFLMDKFSKVLDAFPELKMIKWICVDEIPSESADDWVDVGIAHDTLALIQYTSGSTGLPKGAMITHENLLYNIESMATQFSSTDRNHILCTWLPLFHDMGLIGNMLYPHFLGVRSIVMSPLAFLKNPVKFLEAISHFDAMSGCMPNFGYDLLVRRVEQGGEELKKKLKKQKLNLSNWQIAFCGAEPVRASTVRSFCKTFSEYGFKEQAFYPCYGLAECTLFVAGGTIYEGPAYLPVKVNSLHGRYSAIEECKEGDEGSVVLVASGGNRTGHKLVVVHPDTLATQPERHVGEIWVSGPTVAHGYWNKADINKNVFEGVLSDHAEWGKFCRTGDLGFFNKDKLFVCGRLKDLIIIRGKNIYPNDIEATVEATSDVIRRGCTISFSVDVEDEEVLIVVAEVYPRFSRSEVANLLKEIKENISRNHEIGVHNIVLVAPGVLHKTSSGKVQRSLEKMVFEDGDTEALVIWSGEDGLFFTEEGEKVLAGKTDDLTGKRKIGEVDFAGLAAAAEKELEREMKRDSKRAKTD